MPTEADIYKKVGLFGLCAGHKHTYYCEVIRSNDGLVIERPFSSKTHTLTIPQAVELANTILALCQKQD